MKFEFTSLRHVVSSAEKAWIFSLKIGEKGRTFPRGRPTDAEGHNYHMRTSNGKDFSGTRAEVAQQYIMFDLDLRQKGYSRMRTFDGSGGRDFDLP
jgi:hypothetical protein